MDRLPAILILLLLLLLLVEGEESAGAKATGRQPQAIGRLREWGRARGNGG